MAITSLLKFGFKTNLVKSLISEISSNIGRYYYVFGRPSPWFLVEGLQATLVANSNVVNLTSGTTENIAVGMDITQTAGNGAFGIGAKILSKVSSTQFTVTVLHSTSGDVVFDVKDETIVADATDTYPNEIEVRNESLLYKLIDSNDIAAVIPRINWRAGFIFDMYDEYTQDRPAYSGASSLSTSQFYCMTDEYHVYKCLFNNNNSASSSKPSGTSTLPVVYPDNYIWKYMYTIPLTLRNKFLTLTLMPVTAALYNQFYSAGSIVSYSIENKGRGYPKTSYRIIGFKILNGGSGYTGVPTITIQAPHQTNGVQATCNVAITSNRITAITMTNVGSGYSYSPTFTINTNGVDALNYTQALIEPIIEKTSASYTTLRVVGDGVLEENPYQLQSVRINNAGSGYTGSQVFSPDYVNIISSSGKFSCAIIGASTISVGQSVIISGTNTGTGTITGYTSPKGFKVSDTNTITLSGVQITGTSGQFTCNSTSLAIGQLITISGVFGGTGSITGYVNPKVYKISATNGSTTFTLTNTDDTAIVTTVGTPTGLTYKTIDFTITNLDNTSITTTTGSITGLSVSFVVLSAINFFFENPDLPNGVKPIAEAVIHSGSVIGINIKNVGYGYTYPFTSNQDNANATNLVIFQVSGPGSNANFSMISNKNEAEIYPLINDEGEIEQVVISKPGIGYTVASVIIETSVVPQEEPDFEEASILLDFSIGDIESRQSTVEITAIPGAIHAIQIDDPGAGFQTAPDVIVEGDGTGFQAQAIITDEGQLSRIVVTNPGQNYTRAAVSVTGGGSGAEVRAVISPPGGHGRDSVSELFAKTIMFHTTLSKEKIKKFSASDDPNFAYRQVSILKNPKIYNSNKLLRLGLASSCIIVFGSRNQANFDKLNVGDVMVITKEEVDYRFRIIALEAAYSSVQSAILCSYIDNYLPANGDIMLRSGIIGSANLNDAVNFSVSTVEFPDVDKFTGNLISFDNRTKFSPSEEQIIIATNTITF